VETLAAPGEGALSEIGPDDRVAGVAGASPTAIESDESDDQEKRDRHDERLTVTQHADEFAPSRHTRASSEAGLAGRRGLSPEIRHEQAPGACGPLANDRLDVEAENPAGRSRQGDDQASDLTCGRFRYERVRTL
jgi:hypothetical protein